jgi:hypothetical protein
MNKHLIASLLLATTVGMAAPAFASGYGPAPHYNPVVGAPASQRGQSALTVAAEKNQRDASNSAYGGEKDSTSDTSARTQVVESNTLSSHH